MPSTISIEILLIPSSIEYKIRLEPKIKNANVLISKYLQSSVTLFFVQQQQRL